MRGSLLAVMVGEGFLEEEAFRVGLEGQGDDCYPQPMDMDTFPWMTGNLRWCP